MEPVIDGGVFLSFSPMRVIGYDLLGSNGQEGLRFAWKHDNCRSYIESAAFLQHRKGVTDNICGYTTSVSSGCILQAMKSQCSFCRTGNKIPFGGPLSYTDIAKQNIFMVLADMHCQDHEFLRNRPREFAYMGQGEPGYSYAQVRLAIELTNRIMEELGQTVHRHIFATCGILESIAAYKEDLVNFYTQKVTLHFSLHSANQRANIMPIDNHYSYKDVLNSIEEVFDISGEKPCVGIMLLKNFCANGKSTPYSNDYENVRKILHEIDPKKCRLSFCEYNASEDFGVADIFPQEEAYQLLHMAESMGFEAKLFSSYGRKEQTACGMLGGKEPSKIISTKWIELDALSDELIKRFA